jgi:hypothetical protein
MRYKLTRNRRQDPGWTAIGGVLLGLLGLFILLLQVQSCTRTGKIPQATASKEGRFHLKGPQVVRKAQATLKTGMKDLGPLDFGNQKDSKAAYRPPSPPIPGKGEPGGQSWKATEPVPELSGEWCSVQDQDLGERTLSTLTQFTRGEERQGGFQDHGEAWVGVLDAFDIAHIRFERNATYTAKQECLEWVSSELEFTMAFQEILNHESEEVRLQMRRFQKYFSKLWKLEWLNEDPCQPMKRLNREHIVVKNPHTKLVTHSFRCPEE